MTAPGGDRFAYTGKDQIQIVKKGDGSKPPAPKNAPEIDETEPPTAAELGRE